MDSFFCTPESNYYSNTKFEKLEMTDTYQLVKTANFNISKIRLIIHAGMNQAFR